MTPFNRRTGIYFYIACVFVFFSISCASQKQAETLFLPEVSYDPQVTSLIEAEAGAAEPVPAVFSEIWAYLIDGQEAYLDYAFPVTDVGYFGAEVDSYGTLISVPDRTKIAGFPGRVHLVVACNSTALTHFCLAPASPARAPLIESLIAAAEPYDGLQIDFELVPKKDGAHFLSFLAELKARLGTKTFSVAVPARTRVIENDVYDYEKIAAVADKVFVMAYDEHWSTSAPGSIASLDWCMSIAAHSAGTIPPEKLIMGLPFYGRTWGNVSTNRAFYFSGIQRILRENGVKSVKRENEIPTFTYEIPSVTVTGYYEDVHSLSVRLNLYQQAGIRAAGFWCLGQEDPRIWNMLHIEVTSTSE